MKSEEKAEVGNREIRKPSEFRDLVQVYWIDGHKIKVVSAKEAADRVNTGEYVMIDDKSIKLLPKSEEELSKVRLVFNRRNKQVYVYLNGKIISSYWGVTGIRRNTSNKKWLVQTNGHSIGQVVGHASIEEEWN